MYEAAKPRAASRSSTRPSRAARRARRTASSPSWSAATPTAFARAAARARHLRARGHADGRRRERASSPRWSTRSASPAWSQALSEGINFAQRAGLDAERVLDVISKGAAQSWQMENRGKTMVADKFDFGFAVDWMRKDLAHLPRRGAPQRRGAAGHGARRSALRAACRRAAAALGHVEPHPAARTKPQMNRSVLARVGRRAAASRPPAHAARKSTLQNRVDAAAPRGRPASPAPTSTSCSDATVDARRRVDAGGEDGARSCACTTIGDARRPRRSVRSPAGVRRDARRASPTSAITCASCGRASATVPTASPVPVTLRVQGSRRRQAQSSARGADVPGRRGESGRRSRMPNGADARAREALRCASVRAQLGTRSPSTITIS